MKVYYIPNGPKNLASLFPSINWSNLDQYYVEVTERCDGDTIATSNINNFDGDCCEDTVRLHFQNYSGAIDAINFKMLIKEHEAKSTQYQKAPNYPLVKTEHAASRYNVKANDTLTLYNHDYREEDQAWINELIDSPFILMEWLGTQGQDDSYIPVVIEDSKMLNHKFEDRYQYEVTINVKLSHEKYIIRN